MLTDQIYVVQRVQYAQQGTVLSDDRIERLIDWEDEQNVLAATSALLMAETESQQDPDPAKHCFVMLRAEETWAATGSRRTGETYSAWQTQPRTSIDPSTVAPPLLALGERRWLAERLWQPARLPCCSGERHRV